MRTTLNIDEDLLRDAIALTGTTNKSALVRDALLALIEREAPPRRLGRLGGSDPDAKAPPRRST
jgi:Arc/MetJ family transcription regulator